jgi:hypothetical protein
MLVYIYARFPVRLNIKIQTGIQSSRNSEYFFVTVYRYALIESQDATDIICRFQLNDWYFEHLFCTLYRFKKISVTDDTDLIHKCEKRLICFFKQELKLF